MHAVEYLAKPDAVPVPAVAAISGNQPHLKAESLRVLVQQAVGSDEASVTRMAGKEAEIQAVRDELATVSMWGDRRVVVIDEADEFVTKNRAALEKYVEKPAKKSTLVLELKSFPKNTKLYKLVDKHGLDLDCGELKGAALNKWIGETARNAYGREIGREAVSLLVELVGDDLGVYDRELSKLAAYVGAKGRIDVDDVRALVGGWRLETTWAMTDSIREGDLNHALECLDQLTESGEHALKLLGGIGFVFRKLAFAVELSRGGASLKDALKDAGVFPKDFAAAEAYLRRIGRGKADLLIQRLVEADTGIKGFSRLPDRMQLEQLFLQLAGRA